MPRNRDRNAKYKLDIYVIISEISDENQIRKHLYGL